MGDFEASFDELLVDPIGHQSLSFIEMINVSKANARGQKPFLMMPSTNSRQSWREVWRIIKMGFLPWRSALATLIISIYWVKPTRVRSDHGQKFIRTTLQNTHGPVGGKHLLALPQDFACPCFGPQMSGQSDGMALSSYYGVQYGLTLSNQPTTKRPKRALR